MDLGKSGMNKVTHKNCVYKNLEYYYQDESNVLQHIYFTPSKEETMLCVGVMGLKDWVYCPGEYPLPACFENLLPEPKANVMTLRPSTMTTDRVNGLSPKSDTDDGTYWNDFSGGSYSFLNKEFTTSRLWVDDELTGSVMNGQLPIGKAKITARQGVRYDRTLQSSPAKKTISWPVFESDKDGYVVIDEYGQPVISNYEDMELDVDEPLAYPIFLPYGTTLPINCDVYKPVRLASDDGKTATIELELVDNRQIDAFKPYYVLVNSGSVPLGTTYETVISPTTTDNSISLGDDYEFTGTKYALGETSALENHIYLKDNDDYAIWNITSDKNKKDVAAFSSYFRAKGEKKSEIQLVLEHVEDENFVYEMMFDDDDNRSLVVTKYKGEGGNIVVPATVTATVSGKERTMNVIGIADDVFEEKGGDIRSIDLSQCSELDGVYIDRKMDGNPFHGVNETALIFVPEDKTNMGVNVVVGGVCQKLVLKEGETFYSPYNFKANHVEYKRSMAANDYYTICLPYSAPAKDGLKYYELSGVSDATLQFSEVTETKPGVPYLVVTTSAVEDLDFDGDAETSTDVVKTAVDGSAANGITMLGTFTKLSPAETVGKYILQDGNKWQKAKTENPAVYIDSFHAYLTGSANARELFDSEIGGEATAIKQIHTTDKDGTEQWFDLNGHRIDNMSKKGVYIQKGKKVVLH